MTLTCNAEDGHLPLAYEWNSTCSTGCFITNQTTQSITQDVLRSIDSGVYTCIVTDYVGRNGNGSITLTVTGTVITLIIHTKQKFWCTNVIEYVNYSERGVRINRGFVRN